jgi:CRP-like cAMP-binding protein
MKYSRDPMASVLADHPFFSSLPVASLRRLAHHVYRVEFSPGETVFREGGLADRFFLVRQGAVRLSVEVAGRGQVDVETLGADAALGWSWLMPPYRWHLTATALTRTSALAIDATTLRALMAADPVLGYELMRRFAAIIYDRLRATRERFVRQTISLPDATVSGPWAGKPSVGAASASLTESRYPRPR